MTGRIVVVGNLNVDMIMGPLASWPRTGTECVLPHYELRVGGSAGNAALALHALGAAPILITNVGSDLFGRWLEDGMPMEKAVRREPGDSTVSVGITHADGERTFFTNEGHIGRLDPDFVRSAMARHLGPGAIVLLCGAFLMPDWAAAYPEMIREVRARGGRVALDTGWPPVDWTDRSRRALNDWAGLVDQLLLSEAEVLSLTGLADVPAAAAAVRERMRPESVLVVKMGAAGAAAWTRDAVHSHPAPAVQVVDTIGAGDVFNAGYLAALLRGEPIAHAVRHGVETASLAVSTRPRRYRP